MHQLSPSELVRMRETQSVAMMDTCVLRTHAPTTDDWGTVIDGWTLRENVPCGLKLMQASEALRVTGTISRIVGTLRLSIEDGQNVKPKDSVVVTHRNGEPLTQPLTFGIDGPVSRGRTGVVAQLVEIA